MKHTSKLVCILLAMILVLAMSVPAFAAGTNTITVTGAQANETYSIYKMLDLSVNTDKTAYTYELNDTWKAFFTGSGTGEAYVDITDEKYVTWKESKNTDADKEAFAKAAASYATEKSLTSVVDAKKPTSDGDITFEGLDSGYYLITSTNGTLAMVQTTPQNPNATINEKNPDSIIVKKVQEDSTQLWGKENSAQIGDTVNFKSTVTVKKGAKNYVVHDKMENGLTFSGADSIKIYVGDEKNGTLLENTNYTVAVDTGKTDSDCTFEIKFKQTYLDTVQGDTTLTITYIAVLNENADLTNGEKNDTQLTWGDSSETAWDETVTKTYQFAVLKYNGSDADKSPLAGATFQLKNGETIVKLIKVSETEYRVANGNETGAVDSFETVADGEIVIKGVDLDSYTLTEISAPSGFQVIKDPKTVTVSADNNLTVEVPNNSGIALPSTGGIGTTVFYVVGAALVLGAVVILITRKRMGAK